MTPARARGRLGCAILSAIGLACTSWVMPPGPVQEVVESREVPRIRIRESGETVVLQFPRVLGDSLAGSTTTPKGMRILDERVVYGLDEIEEFEVEQFDWGRTTLAIGAFLGAWLGLMLVAVHSSR